jgi:hypothetical protein
VVEIIFVLEVFVLLGFDTLLGFWLEVEVVVVVVVVNFFFDVFVFLGLVTLLDFWDVVVGVAIVTVVISIDVCLLVVLVTIVVVSIDIGLTVFTILPFKSKGLIIKINDLIK